MLSYLLVPMLVLSTAASSILPKRDIPDNTTPTGNNPIQVASTQYLGHLVADNSCSRRDLGFTGEIKGNWYAIYGDTLYCQPGVTDPYNNFKSAGMVRDAISAVTNDPLKVHDLNLNSDKPVAHQKQFVPYDSSWGETSSYGFGGTSLCETNSTAGEAAFFYLINTNNGLKGAGVARISTAFGTPTVEKRFGNQGFWWNSTTLPRYGDQAAYRDVNSDYIYAWGGAPTSIGGQYVYQTRVLASNAFDLTKYEYWHGRAQGWSTTPLTTFNTETAVMWSPGQGQVVYSPYYKTYIYVHIATDLKSVALRTAPKPEGPWSKDLLVYDSNPPQGDLSYAGVAHPYLDTSGKTLTVSYTKQSNILEVVKITFK